MNIAKTMEKDNENNNFVNIVSKVEHRFCYLFDQDRKSVV